MTCHYEWDIETYDSDAGDIEGEIHEHHHEDSIGAFSKQDLRDALARNGKRLVLVRDRFSKTGDALDDRLWAYVTHARELPAYFSDSANQETEVKVPKIFAKEFAAMLEAL